jgi:hypothetical protein
MCIFFIAIETYTQTTSLRHLVRGEAPLISLTAALLGGRWWSRERQLRWGRRKCWSWRGRGQAAVRWRAS